MILKKINTEGQKVWVSVNIVIYTLVNSHIWVIYNSTLFMEIIPLNCDNVTSFMWMPKNVCLKMNNYFKPFYINILYSSIIRYGHITSCNDNIKRKSMKDKREVHIKLGNIKFVIS